MGRRRMCRPLALCCLGLLVLVTKSSGAAEGYVEAASVGQAEAALLAELARESLLATAEKRLPAVKLPPEHPFVSARNGVHVVLLVPGQEVRQAAVRQSTLMGNLRVAAARLVAQGVPDLERTTLLVTLLGADEPLQVAPTPAGLRPVADLGVHGIAAESRGLQAFVSPVEPMLAGQDWKSVLTRLALEVSPAPPGLDDRARETHVLKVLTDDTFHIGRVAAVTVLQMPGRPAETLVRLDRLVPVTDVTPQDVDQSLRLALNWCLSQKTEAGLFAEAGGAATQAEALWTLVRLALAMRETSALQSARQGLDALLAKFYVEEDATGAGYLREESKASLVAAAAVLLAESELAGQAETAPNVRKLARFLECLRNADGRLDLVYPPEDSGLGEEEAGLAQMALLKSVARLPEAERQKALIGIRQSMNYYRSAFWKEQRFTFIPRHTHAAMLLQRLMPGGDADLVTFAFRMNDIVVAAQQVRPVPGEWLSPDAQGRFVSPKTRRLESPEIATTAGCIEGLAAALTLARENGDKRREAEYRRALLWGLRALLQAQIADEVDLLRWDEVDRGAFRTRLEEPRLRLRDTLRAASALLVAREALRETDYAETARLAQESLLPVR